VDQCLNNIGFQCRPGANYADVEAVLRVESGVRLRNALRTRMLMHSSALSAMKFRPFLSLAATLILSAAASPSIAERNDGSPYGDPAQSSAATREILIDPNTRHVNVKQGEIVNFDVGGKTFAWHFNGRSDPRAFDLRDIAPPDTLDRPVTVYVAGDPNDKG
jgi:hypothetical protein